MHEEKIYIDENLSLDDAAKYLSLPPHKYSLSSMLGETKTMGITIKFEGTVLDESKAAVVDVDVMNQICNVTVDTTAGFSSSTGTTVDVNVECFGVDFADVHVDTRD